MRTGDLGYIDGERDLHYVGRTKETIKTGAFSVDPLEVQNALLTLNAVREAAVLGVDDERWGEMYRRVRLASPRDDARRAGRDRHLPRSDRGLQDTQEAFVLDELPKNPTGKVERGVLRHRYRELTREQMQAG